MHLTQTEKEKLLKYFPNVELSYEKRLHKKVHTDMCLTIPKGKKAFAWFKNFKNSNVCFLLYINKRYNKIEEITVNVCCFDKILCSNRGTLFYGTVFFVDKKKFFNIENIYYSKGYSLIHTNQYQKFKEISNISRNYIKQKSYVSNGIIFGTPLMDTNSYKLKEKINDLPYELYCIQHRLLFKSKPFLNEIITVRREIYKYFQIRATIINDIYDLYYDNNTNIEKYKTACIPDYKTSVMMNSLFRNIKENNNLDTLEESDDEEEFENISLDKFVNLEKKITMKCVFIHKFDSWKPIEISTNKISPRREIIYYKKK